MPLQNLPRRWSNIKFETQFFLSTEKFSEMKDEIPQSVIDSHVKNAANARAEKVKQENSDESKGSMDCFQSPYCVVRFLRLHVENFTFLLHITLHSKTDRATVNKSFNFPCVIQKKHHNPWK